MWAARTGTINQTLRNALSKRTTSQTELSNFEQLLRESIDSKRERNGKRGEKQAQEIGFLCLYYSEKLKEELGVPVMELEWPAWGCGVIDVDGSGLKMPCTTSRGGKAAVLAGIIAGSASYLGVCSCSSLELGARHQGKNLPGDLLGQTCASCIWVDLCLASGFF